MVSIPLVYLLGGFALVFFVGLGCGILLWVSVGYHVAKRQRQPTPQEEFEIAREELKRLIGESVEG